MLIFHRSGNDFIFGAGVELRLSLSQRIGRNKILLPYLQLTDILQKIDYFQTDSGKREGEKVGTLPACAIWVEGKPITDLLMVWNAGRGNELLMGVRLYFAVVGPVEADPEYEVIVEANNITVEIDNEISKFCAGLISNIFLSSSTVASQQLVVLL